MKSGGQVKKTQKVPAPVKGKKGGKQRPALQTPVDFANNLIAENAIKPIAKPKHTPFLKDMNIFYYGQEKEWVSDTSRGRMKLVSYIKHNIITVLSVLSSASRFCNMAAPCVLLSTRSL